MEFVGKMLKSKINGKLFYVAELFTDDISKKQYYKICEPGTDNYTAVSKEWFEVGLMQNLEVVKL